MKINNETIIKDDDPMLRERSLDVKLPLSAQDKSLLQDLYDYVDRSTDPEIAEKEDLQAAVGISAIQVGIKKKMCAIILKDKDGRIVHGYALANPKIIKESVEEAYLESGEGCLSVPEAHEGYVYRHRRITVRGYDLLREQEVKIEAKDYLAIVFQHELDHFKGILYYDHINKEQPFMKKDGAHCIE